MRDATFRELAANRVGAYVGAYTSAHADDRPTAVQDMITDVLHMLAPDTETFETIMRRAVENYLSELADDLAGVPTGVTVEDHLAGATREQIATLARVCAVLESAGIDTTETRARIDARLTELDRINTIGDMSNA